MKKYLDRSKPYSVILEEAIEEGVREINRSNLKLLISAISAGLDLGFSVLLMSAFLSVAANQVPFLVETIGVNLLYAVGFVFVVVGRSELFTEHTTLTILPVIDQKANIKSLLRVWFIILGGNLFGALIFAYITSKIGTAHGIVNDEIVSHVYHNLLEKSNLLMFSSAILAGWLMGLLTWLVHASKETLSDIIIVIMITFSIGFLQLHHSIAGAVEVFLAMFAGGGILFSQLTNFLFWVILGNTVGGVLFVGILKYSHAKK